MSYMCLTDKKVELTKIGSTLELSILLSVHLVVLSIVLKVNDHLNEN